MQCKKHLLKLKKNINLFMKRNIKFITISTDSVRNLKKFSEENSFNYSMISDRGGKIAKAYNIYTFGKIIDIVYLKIKLAIPSSFLINKDGVIVWQYIGSREDRPSIEDLIEAIDKNLMNPS
jgi:peroxiredoxin